MKHLQSALFLPLVLVTTTAWARAASAQEDLRDRLWSTFVSSDHVDREAPQKDVGGAPLDPEQLARERERNAPQGTPPRNAGGALFGTIPNDLCSQAWVVPSNAVTWGATQSTVGALGEACGAIPSCALNTSASVWFEYTPAADGLAEFNTFGSNYDTVLSVFDRCGFVVGFLCNSPEELACNDNASFGTQSQVFVSVVAGVTYKILVAGKGGGGNLDFDFVYYPPNDNCFNATPISGTAFDPPLLATDNAQTDLCEADEDCEFNGVGVSNSVFYSYTPPCNGFLNLNTNGSDYDTVLSVWDGCGEFVAVDAPCIEPNLLACDDDTGLGLASQLMDVPVMEGQTYLIKVADYNLNQGGGLLDFNLIFLGASEPVAELTSQENFDCVSGAVAAFGSANTGLDPLVNWTLEYQDVDGGPWVEVTVGVLPVTDGFVGTWQTDGLDEGYYFLRLTVTNGCGQSASDVRVLLVDRNFGNLDLRRPVPNAVVGGLVPIDGTASDVCFGSYEVEVRPEGGSFQPVAAPSYPSPVINDPLVPIGWDSQTVNDGVYELRLYGVDTAGNDEEQRVIVVVDNTPPTAILSSPQSCEQLTGTVAIFGTANDFNLDRWVLQYTGGSDNTWTTLATGNSPVVNGFLANWDLSGLERCAHTLRLLVYDQSIINGVDQQVTESLTSVYVGICGRPVQAPVGG